MSTDVSGRAHYSNRAVAIVGTATALPHLSSPSHSARCDLPWLDQQEEEEEIQRSSENGGHGDFPSAHTLYPFLEHELDHVLDHSRYNNLNFGFIPGRRWGTIPSPPTHPHARSARSARDLAVHARRRIAPSPPRSLRAPGPGRQRPIPTAGRRMHTHARTQHNTHTHGHGLLLTEFRKVTFTFSLHRNGDK